MALRCEVCENFRPDGDPRPLELVRVPLGKRIVLLCTGHARIAENSGVSNFEQLRELYGESEGRRSFVPRRAPRSRWEGSQGRRASDP